MKKVIPKIRKALVAGAAACAITAAAVADQSISIEEAVAVATAWSAVFGVWFATNAPSEFPPPAPNTSIKEN